MATKKFSNNKSLFVLPLIILLGITAACLLPTSLLTGEEPSGSLVLDYSPPPGQQEPESYRLSADQLDQISKSGYPDRFLILFFQETDDSQEENEFRQETWYYDQAGLETVFQNGSLLYRNHVVPPKIDSLGRTPYNPEMFNFGMNLAQISSAIAQDQFYRESLPEGMSSGGELIYFQGLVVGLQEDQIMYVETLPIGAAGLPYQELDASIQESPENEGSQVNGGDSSSPSLTGTVIYTINDANNYEVYALDLETGQEINLSSSPAEDVYAACSPATGKVYFISDRSGIDQVYTTSRDGSNLQQVTGSNSSKDFLNLYSDTELIYWQWDGSLENSYVLFNMNDGSERSVDEEVGKNYSQSIAVEPTGAMVAISEKRGEEDPEIWLINLSSGEETQITDNDTADINPVWSPDGSWLIYSNQGDLWSYNRDDGSTMQVTQTEGWSEISACWLEN